MTTTESVDGGPLKPDERIAFRGPMQRLLISPEIGALVGATVVWGLFWATGQKFGLASTTLSWLDAAAPFGIMSVAVALLMIGGEFDLSSGVIVGSTGIFVGVFGQKFMGSGAPMWLAVLLAFAAAGLVGYLNGWLVNRTGLPSFIVTLATFFALRGVNLVLSKRLMNKVTVENINAETIKGAGPFQAVFSNASKLDTFSARDLVFHILVIAGAVLGLFGVLEQSLVRRRHAHPAWKDPTVAAARAEDDCPPLWAIPAAVLGLAGVVVGLVLVHRTDGIGANTLAVVCGLGGAILLTVGFAAFRYLTTRPHGDAMPTGKALTYTVAGVAAAVVGWLGTRSLEQADRRQLLSIPPHWVKVLLGAAGAAVAGGLVLRWALGQLRRQRAGGQRIGAMAVPRIAFVTLIAAGTGLVLTILFLQIATVQGFRAIVLTGLGIGGILLVLSAKAIARKQSPRAQLVVGLVAAALIVAFAFVVRADSSTERFRAALFAVLLMVAAAVVGNALVEYRQVKRAAFDAPADRAGRVAAVLGVLMACAGMAIRLLYTHQNVYRWVFWWIGITVIAGYVLSRTKWGNWIFAVGGNKDAARAVGVPADQVKIGLFVTVSLLGCLVGIMTALRFTSMPAATGVGKEFEYIIGAVVGGCLMTGGYGSVIGASIGAMIAPMTLTGIPMSRWDGDNRFIFLGVVLLAAVLVNQKIRKKAQEAR